MKLEMLVRNQLKTVARLSSFENSKITKNLISNVDICFVEIYTGKRKAGKQEFPDQFLSNQGALITFSTFL